jgi:hypothetical protein
MTHAAPAPQSVLVNVRLIPAVEPQFCNSKCGVFSEGEEASLWQAHAFQQVDIARLRAERIHRFNDLDSLQASCFLGIRFLQPIESLILIAESRVIL